MSPLNHSLSITIKFHATLQSRELISCGSLLPMKRRGMEGLPEGGNEGGGLVRVMEEGEDGE